jgi:hypothetical protein
MVHPRDSESKEKCLNAGLQWYNWAISPDQWWWKGAIHLPENIPQNDAGATKDQDQRKYTGANWVATWKSSTLGGWDITDAATLIGNSANAEPAAGQRSLTVRRMLILYFICWYLSHKVINRQRKLFTQYNTPQVIELADALVGAQTAFWPQHCVLKSGMYAFVIVDDQLYVAQGMSYSTYRHPAIDIFEFK